MKNSTFASHQRISQFLLAIISLGFTASPMAECVDSYSFADSAYQNATITAIDANNGCDDIKGQEGCTINNPSLSKSNTCSFTGPDGHFTATLTSFGEHGLAWEISNNCDNEGKNCTLIDTVTFGGGSQGKNNCGVVLAGEVGDGSGGDCKSPINPDGTCPNADFQNYTSVSFCADFIAEIPPPPSVGPLISCNDPSLYDEESGTYKLDDTGIVCPDADLDGKPGPDPVIVCNLQTTVTDFGTTDGSDVCCQCNIPDNTQSACYATPGNPECEAVSGSAETQETVELKFYKDDTDPCGDFKTRDGYITRCW